MTYTELLKSIAEENDLSVLAVRQVLDSLCRNIIEEAQNGKTVRIPSLGTFSRLDRAERPGRNPTTGETVMIPANSTIKFKAGKSVLEALN